MTVGVFSGVDDEYDAFDALNSLDPLENQQPQAVATASTSAAAAVAPTVSNSMSGGSNIPNGGVVSANTNYTNVR